MAVLTNRIVLPNVFEKLSSWMILPFDNTVNLRSLLKIYMNITYLFKTFTFLDVFTYQVSWKWSLYIPQLSQGVWKEISDIKWATIYKITYLVRAQKFLKSNISYPLIRTLMCAYQGLRNVSFSENLAYELNEWSLYNIN